jgi:hypothetical protein
MTKDKASDLFAVKTDFGAFVEQVREQERSQREEGISYTGQHVRQSIVHTREDIALIAAHLGDINLALEAIYEKENGLQFRLSILIALMIILTVLLGLKI